jgi:pimeloyl-ACP methyl ester carboxylesterase
VTHEREKERESHQKGTEKNMNTNMKWGQGIALSALWLGLAAGCGQGAHRGTGGPQSAVERYVRTFRNENPYVDRSVVRGGDRIAVRQFSASQAASGPPIILMHGYPDSQHLYDAVVPLLRRERDVVTFDFLGWGDSDKPSPSAHRYDAASLRADLEAVLEQLGIDEAVLVVHDASGWPGIDFALDHPERVAALVVLNTVYHPVASSRPPEGLAQYARPSAQRDALEQRALVDDSFWLDGSAAEGGIGFRTQIAKFFSNATAREAMLPLFAEQSLSMRPAFFALAAELIPEITARGAAIARMATFERPVTVAFGADDPYLNLGVAADFAARFANSERIDIPGGNHYVQLDQPGRVAEAILGATRGH